MNERAFWSLGGVSDAALQEQLKELLAKGARTEARIVAHLAEVEARRLDLSLGASSLFDYCLNWLGLSNNEAFHRITAARLARRFPVIFELLERRDVHLTAVCLLRDHLTEENHQQLLRAVSHKTKREIQQLLAERFPEAHIEGRIRTIVARGLRPISSDYYRVEFDASRVLKGKIELALDLMSHANPTHDLATATERAFDALLEKLQSKRFAQTKRKTEQTCAQSQPRPQTKAGLEATDARARRARVKSKVVRAVLERDGQRCTFVGSDGQRCSARAFLQLHHERAWALGGPETVENLSVVCRAHNRLLAERELGRERVAAMITEARRR